ncbi:MAG: acetate/propionate family kinase [Fibrobacterota bacterium]
MKSENKTRNILVLNCGSSSLKYKVLRMPDETELIAGEAERVGIRTQATPLVTHRAFGKTRTLTVDLPDHASAFRKALELIAEDTAQNPGAAFHAFGHRYVHPWTFFDKTTRVDDAVISQLRKTLPLAPIHNPISFSLIEVCRQDYAHIPQFIIFDTAFHSTIPEELRAYALPKRVVQRHGLRKYGFHGISYQFVMSEACRFLNRDMATQRLIGCHLGTGGSSVCAVRDGKSIMTSLGFTPLEGLVMNTRSGDMDLGLMFSLMFRNNLSCDDVEALLNKKSGVLGVFGASSDMRDVVKKIADDPRAALAFALYTRRVKKYAGYGGLLLEKADALIFTDTLGVQVPEVRSEICKGLDYLGIRIDETKNRAYTDGNADVSAEGSETRILVIPTDEEILIARETYRECA